MMWQVLVTQFVIVSSLYGDTEAQSLNRVRTYYVPTPCLTSPVSGLALQPQYEYESCRCAIEELGALLQLLKSLDDDDPVINCGLSEEIILKLVNALIYTATQNFLLYDFSVALNVTMSSQVTCEALKTNDFLRRRKLRLQQVREQSKDIAKRIRQRAQVEKLKQFDDLDEKKRKVYLQKQEELIKKLEDLYTKGVESVGVSHRSASEAKEQDILPNKIDLSKKRGKEAAAELRRKRQERLDEQKKLLDKRLQAREAANEISREKSASLAHKTKTKLTEDIQAKAPETETDKNVENINKPLVVQTDMATQWDFDEIPNEWEPNVLTLSLPKDDRDSVKESKNNIESKSDQSKRIDLFAVSEEMPSSLRGGVTNEERIPLKPSLTLVTEYLQSRGMRLRETATSVSNKKDKDLHSLKQTIQRTRSSKTEVSEKSSNIDNSTKSSAQGSALAKKNSVTQYNHMTRDSRDMPYGVEKHVIRDSQDTEDAYSQAIKESSLGIGKENEHLKKLQDMRSKVAMTKQSVEKEYKDTMSFLNSVPKEKPSKRVTNAFMDDHRQQLQNENRQQKLQHEYKKVERECRKHSCTKKSRDKSRSPIKSNKDFNNQDFQYSWMPVPESDASLAVHTVPTNIRESKSGNIVKFSSVDSYHEYRTRHKHTPPTKDTGSQNKRIEAVIVQDNSDSVDSSRSSTSESSAENIVLQKTRNEKTNLSDAERIIVYKILDSKTSKKTKKAKLVREIAKSLRSMNKNNEITDAIKETNKQKTKIDTDSAVPFEEVREGIYKTVNEKEGMSYNVMSCYTTNVEMWHSETNPKPWWDNITSMYFPENPNNDVDQVVNKEQWKNGQPFCCNKKSQRNHQSDKGNPANCGEYATSKQPSAIRPSAATSTSSFRTATTDKANSALPDSGYIKLVDEGGQEKGNFYIGASGFLKDDAYEVVIQLRKKDGNKEDKALDEKSLDRTPKTKTDDVTEDNSVVATGVHVLPVNGNKADVISEINDGLLEEYNTKDLIKQIITESAKSVCSGNSNLDLVTERPIDQDKYVSKGVHTSFEMSYAIPDNILKTDSVPRPATSTYTQTSLSSPNHRPIFFHMSSSTSTAYMSPPEMVLPNFLRKDYRITDEEIYESIQNYNSKDQIELDEQEYTEEFDGCKCKRCLHARKVTVCKAKESIINKYDTEKLQTPPNTARSSAKSYKDYNKNVHKTPTTASNKTNCKCKKCQTKTKLNMTIRNINTNKNKRPVTCRKRPSRHIIGPSSSAGISHKSKTYPSSCDVQKLGLNPVIKFYVDRLLALNKEGLKAVEVADQECSSVATPGSSIINISRNINENKTHLEENISLEQIKNMLKKQILEEIAKENKNIQNRPIEVVCPKTIVHKNVHVPRLPLKKPVHKVKSCNISKHLLKSKNSNLKKQMSNINTLFISSKTMAKKSVPSTLPLAKTHNKSSPTTGKFNYLNSVNRKVTSDIENETNTKDNIESNINLFKSSTAYCELDVQKPCQKVSSRLVATNRATTTDTSLESNMHRVFQKSQKSEDIPINTATQTKENAASDTNLIKVAEDKLQNMEKIADLTEKCTLRLSNLAKVLEEVRKNKSLIYGHLSTSDSASDSDQKSEKYGAGNKTPSNRNIYDPTSDTDKTSEKKSPISVSTIEADVSLCKTDYVPLLTDIPKPALFIPTNFTDQLSPLSSIHIENASVKNRGRPPPALSRIHLKNGQEYVVPHELSTVLEVDSPMSVKLKNQSSRDKNSNGANGSHINGNVSRGSNFDANVNDTNTNPDVLPSGSNSRKQPTRLSFSDSSDDSKLQMIDLSQFNDIMLKPFISFKEHAKQCNIVGTDEGSNIDDNPKEGANDDISSLHSDGSLPDVIAELLKRNIITEPFKYDTTSNVNSTTISSESTLSVLALSKMRKDKRKSNVPLNNKENMVESSDTLSMSSNPDLEKAFKKLGMGWASSTLKKTKERLALSSSSNTSSSSLSQFKLNGFQNFVIPALVTDSLSTVLNDSKKPSKPRQSSESAKNAEQQTSKTNSMTVKEFLNKELAKKITFTSQSRKDDTDEEFMSLAETKMPEQIKNLGQTILEEGTFDSVLSVKENRARTSTPVQLFKSGTYHSSSSSNISNGLFSNADDLSSVKVTSNSIKNHSTSEKDDLAVPNFSLRKKKSVSDCSKSD
ncbi:hypothetical protein K1T71_003436 [Dendrolimus kikuchii]|uniref:Uncharacterized protein n=1 Tax=Dendrolimus kikuchii TaxID=765133 RepID=A0ACC1DCG5_9NEOP|nr:hypothetical protein K1T71_003436 [Dendrolimus kikuchii]